MIAVDTCVVIAFLQGETGPDVDAFAALLASEQAVLAPSAVTELLSDPRGGPATADVVGKLKQISLEAGYWERAGATRAAIRRNGRKAALGDALIAQACIDAGIPLLTRDSDFKAFESLTGLKLA